MYFSDALKVVLRRWRIVVVGFVLMVGAGLFAINVVPTGHQASGQVLLLPPVEPTPVGAPKPLHEPTFRAFFHCIVGRRRGHHEGRQPDMTTAGFASPYSV